MYRQYENPRLLEAQLKELKLNRESVLNSINNLQGVGLTDLRTGYTSYDVLSDQLEYYDDQISELEQRINFAWQDEEFG